MFDLLEDRKRPEIRWWTIPSATVSIFCAGVGVGILIGRRVTDPFEWLQVVLLVMVGLMVLWPVGRELAILRTKEGNKADAH